MYADAPKSVSRLLLRKGFISCSMLWLPYSMLFEKGVIPVSTHLMTPHSMRWLRVNLALRIKVALASFGTWLILETDGRNSVSL
jgi:hypothetical protein